MKTFSHKLQQRGVRQPFQFRLIGSVARQIADLLQVFFFDRIGGVSHGHLIQHPLINRAGLRHCVRVLVGDECFPEKFPRSSVDLSGAEIVIIQKNLEPCGRIFVIIRQRDRINSWRRRNRLLRECMSKDRCSKSQQCRNQQFHRLE